MRRLLARLCALAHGAITMRLRNEGHEVSKGIKQSRPARAWVQVAMRQLGTSAIQKKLCLKEKCAPHVAWDTAANFDHPPTPASVIAIALAALGVPFSGHRCAEPFVLGVGRHLRPVAIAH